MNRPESISQRIQRIASERKLTLASLNAKLDINSARLDALWKGLAVPEYKELAMLAKVLDVDEAVLLNGRAERLWLRLKKIAQEWRFPKLWPVLAQHTGSRGPDSPETEEAQDELILEDQKEQLWTPDDPLPWWER